MTTDKLLEITNKTMVPASLIIAGWFGISWLIDLRTDVDVNALEIKEHKTHQAKVIEKLDRNNERLAKIEEAMEFIKEKLK